MHIRYVVKYEDYRRFHTKSRIIYNGDTLAPAAPGTTTPPPATQPGATSDTPSDMPPPDPNAPALNRGKPKP